MDGWMDGWMNGWMDEWMDGWMDVGLLSHVRSDSTYHMPLRRQPTSQPISEPSVLATPDNEWVWSVVKPAKYRRRDCRVIAD
eukprot:1186391-Prorocentrum_minimum.AAC.4